MRIASLGSGSKGNAAILEVAGDCYLIDCGFGLKEIESRLLNMGIQPSCLSAIFVTHEHGDHIKGAPMLANRYGIPLWSTHGTARHLKRVVPTAHQFVPNTCLNFGALEVETVTVPHDSSEPSQFVFRHQGLSVGVLTDLGSISKRVLSAYNDCQVLMLECNHDPQMLQDGSYPPSLKRRVGGAFGHLSNQQAVDFLNQINKSVLSKLLISHISEKNNDPSLAITMVEQALQDTQCEIELLTQDEGCDWITLTH